MGMIFHTITDEDLRMAEHLAPPNELDRLSLPGYMGILAVDEDRRVACGLAICQMVSIDRLDIVWLYVYDEFRGRGVGEELIMASCDLAVEYGYDYIGFKVEAGDLSNSEINDLDGYLVSNGFSLGFDIEGSIMADIDDVEIRLDNIKDSGKVAPVEKNDIKEIWEFIQEVSILFDKQKFTKSSFAADLSFSYKKDGNIQGLLLSKVIGETIYVYLMEPSDNEDVCGMLLKTLVKKAEGLGVKAFSVTRCESNNETLDILFDKKYSLPAHLWIANADMYKNVDVSAYEDDPIYVDIPKRVRWLKTELYGDV